MKIFKNTVTTILLFAIVYSLYCLYLCLTYHYSVYYNEGNIIIKKIMMIQGNMGDCKFVKNYSDFKISQSHIYHDGSDIELIKTLYKKCSNYKEDLDFLNSFENEKTAYTSKHSIFFISKYFYFLNKDSMRMKLNNLPKNESVIILQNKLEQ